eukprot:4840956-Pyramimonas_sp.AAC.1
MRRFVSVSSRSMPPSNSCNLRANTSFCLSNGNNSSSTLAGIPAALKNARGLPRLVSTSMNVTREMCVV